MYTINTPEELHAARDVLGYYNLPEGYSPGSFTTQLLRLLEVSDYFNRAKLLTTFTEFLPAIDIMAQQGGEALVEAVKEASK